MSLEVASARPREAGRASRAQRLTASCATVASILIDVRRRSKMRKKSRGGQLSLQR